jgi:outer membrane protein OmpA-like peptidoglycan-associated protein
LSKIDATFPSLAVRMALAAVNFTYILSGKENAIGEDTIMAEGHKSFLTGVGTGLVIILLVVPVGYMLWTRAAAERAQMLAALSAIDGKLAKTDAAVAAMQKTASLAGVTKQLDELNGRIKSANEALAGVQKASLDEIRNRLDQVESGLKSDSANLAALQKGLGPDGLNKRLGQLSANLAALETSLASIKQASGAGAPVRTANALDAMKTGSVPAHGATDLVVVHVQEPGATQAAGAIAPLSVNFQQIGGTDETAQTVAVVAKLKNLLKGRKGCAVSVAGFADTLGPDDLNLEVSKDRAHVIAAKLKEALGPDVEIAETAWGERRLHEMTKDNVADKLNRRVDIAVQCKS